MSPSQRYSFDDNDEYEAAGNGVRDGQRTPRDDDEDDDEDEYGEQSSPSKRPQSQGGSNKKNSTATPQMGSEATIRSLSVHSFRSCVLLLFLTLPPRMPGI